MITIKLLNLPNKPYFSLIVPVYGCAECLEVLYQRIKCTLEPINPNFEIILINDKSPDDSWQVILNLCNKDKRVKGIAMSKNFGQHYAISAGFDYAFGEWIVVMDCDLQDQPEEIIKLYNKAFEGYDIVYGISKFRGKPNWITNFFRKTYFKIYDALTQNDFKTENLSFYILNKKVRDEIILFREQSRHISSLIRHIGFSITGIPVEHKEREFGESAYTFRKRFKLALEGILSYSSTLLRFSLYVGFIFSFLSIAFGFFILFRKFIMSESLEGWTSLITLLAFSTGLILSVLGINGIYLEKIYLESKRRPLYVVKDLINIEKE